MIRPTTMPETKPSNICLFISTDLNINHSTNLQSSVMGDLFGSSSLHNLHRRGSSAPRINANKRIAGNGTTSSRSDNPET
ncbi:hypothetical protein PIB30_058319 [Stylosanthes scabra]|uniref:Uncharacterized protein n=1 Tax=Stylosanthes scabra TaxID=79078 RepID=A0ABU6UKR3_9FABA|nr:hypothetical protein [Stylosanthes scabra]